MSSLTRTSAYRLTTMANASVQQLRDAIRRVTTAHAASVDLLDEAEFRAGVEVSDSTWGEWEDTTFDVRQHA
jgi:hypothetical protein